MTTKDLQRSLSHPLAARAPVKLLVGGVLYDADYTRLKDGKFMIVAYQQPKRKKPFGGALKAIPQPQDDED